MEFDYQNCHLCPRECGVDRRTARGYCGGGGEAVVAKAMTHFWEEPTVSGTRGSGAVFFSGCNLRCNYCQNREISFALRGDRMSADDLCALFFDLKARGAHNINLVTATPYLPTVLPALRLAKRRGLRLPVIYNTGGYEKTETIDALSDVVDVWLPDLKYADGALAAKYSAAPDYPEVAVRAIDRMAEAAGRPSIRNGLIRRGVIVRHLVLPGHRDDTARVLGTVAERWGDRVLLSLMRQYTPSFASPDCDMKRRVTSFEYGSALRLAERLGLRGYFQDASSATAAYTPDFG